MTPPPPGAGDAAHGNTARGDTARSARVEWERRQDEQALAYRFLGRCFHAPPSPDWMAALAQDRMFREWPFPSADDDAATGLALLTAFCESWEPAMLGRLTWDFNRLFVGPGEMRAAPWESVYRSKTKLTFQEPTLAVRALYERFGFESPAIHREPDDHLALELDFLAALSALAAEAARDGDGERLATCFSTQQAFLKEHLLAWAPRCLTLVVEHAETDYYRGAARLALGSLAESARICGVSAPVARVVQGSAAAPAGTPSPAARPRPD
ncbi:MAG: molecular chaperone TorD family protein [Acidobacteria bacterium]|nr:molecular chaperone TorD family protein [Acidobacteriota bacterium]